MKSAKNPELISAISLNKFRIALCNLAQQKICEHRNKIRQRKILEHKFKLFKARNFEEKV